MCLVYGFSAHIYLLHNYLVNDSMKNQKQLCFSLSYSNAVIVNVPDLINVLCTLSVSNNL